MSLRMGGTNIDDKDFLAEMEEKLFGSKQRNEEDLHITEKNFIPIKTGVDNYKLLKYGPLHILDADDFEPLYIH